MKKKKFKHIFKNQTQIGKLFGISAIEVGKILSDCELRDPVTKQATQFAIDENYAKFTPLKDGTTFYMWNIEKISPLIAKIHKQLSEERIVINNIKEVIRRAKKLFDRGEDKLGYMIYDSLYDDIKSDLVSRIEGIAELEIKVEEFSSNFDEGIILFFESISSYPHYKYYADHIETINKFYPQYKYLIQKFEKLISIG